MKHALLSSTRFCEPFSLPSLGGDVVTLRCTKPIYACGSITCSIIDGKPHVITSCPPGCWEIV